MTVAEFQYRHHVRKAIEHLKKAEHTAITTADQNIKNTLPKIGNCKRTLNTITILTPVFKN